MPTIYSEGPGYIVYDLVPSGAKSTQLSVDETTIYIAMATGEILVYGLASQSLLQTINVAASLGSMTLSDDGSKAYVIGKATPGGPSAIYEVNLATGVSSVLPNTQALGPTDIEYIDGNRLLVSGSQTWFYNLTTQQASTPTGVNAVGFSSPTIMVESDGLVLIAETGISNGPLELYDETTGTLIGAGNSDQGGSPLGFNYGIQAVSREGGLVAQGIYPEHLEIYDLSLTLVTSLPYFGSYGGGLAFDSEGDFLIAYRAGQFGGTIAAFSTDSWTASLIIDVRPVSSWYFDGGTGDALQITSDDTFIILTDVQNGFVQIVELTSPLGSVSGVVGSNNDDNLTAVMGQDVDGRDGVDILSISFLSATSGVSADFRQLAGGNPIVIEGATITSIEIIGQIDGSNFNDVIGAYQLYGNTGVTIYGHDGDDQIYLTLPVYITHVSGDAGNDVIDARGHTAGGDYFGGAGNDTIYTDQSGSAVGVGGDGDDTIESWGYAYGDDGNDTIVMHDPIDVSGARPHGQGGNGNDTINAAAGSTDDHQYSGGFGADILTGGDGNDFLTSANFAGNNISDEDTGTEHDQLSGGAGNDFLAIGYGDNADGGTGTDRLQLSLGGAPGGVTLDTADLIGPDPLLLGGGTIQNMEYVDRLYGTSHDDNFTIAASSVASRIGVFGGAGNDTVTDTGVYMDFFGGAGNDRLIASVNQVYFHGGDGTDTIDYSTYDSGVTVALGTAFQQGSGPDGSSFLEVENIVGTDFADTLTGNSLANSIDGRAGDDIIEGGGGNDTLIGGSGTDTASYASAAGGVTVSLAVAGPQNTGGAGTDTLTDFENLTGSALADTLTGNNAANVLSGGLGDDTYHVQSQADLVLENPGEGTDTVVSTSSFYLYANIEHLTLADGAGDLFGVGNDLGNTLTGNAGSNLLIGGDGNDTLYGVDGVDSLFGEAGNDIVAGGAGNDYLVGGTGDDTLNGGENGDAIYGEDGNDLLIGGSDFITDILVGGAGDDTLYANSGLNDYDLIDGGSGNDYYYVDTGDDLTFEAADGGTDTVYADVSNVPNAGVYLYPNVENLVLIGTTAFGVGNGLNNVLSGSASANWLLGGAGNDAINGGAGNDVLFGEAGSDTFVFGTGNGADVIGDFNAAEDVINLAAYNFASFEALQAVFEQVGSDGAIHLGDGNLIVLHNVTMSTLDAGDFVL